MGRLLSPVSFVAYYFKHRNLQLIRQLHSALYILATSHNFIQAFYTMMILAEMHEWILEST